MNEVGRTANTLYLKQTLVVMVLSSHCAEESPTNRTPSYLSLRPCRLGGSGSIKEELSREEHVVFSQVPNKKKRKEKNRKLLT